jgi:Ca-activated chloride channel family protein
MKIYRLDNPWALLFLIFPILCLFIFISSRFIFKKGVKITGVSEFERGISLAPFFYFLTITIILLGLFIIAFSLSNPQYGIKKEKITTKGIDIMISLDTSGSMTIKDFLKQSRIQGAKNILENFIDKRKGDRIGLVTFADSSFLKCPATINYDLLKSIINKIEIDPNKRTAIGIGLASAINRILKIKDETEPISKIIILVTDGKNNTGEISPEAATEIAIQTNIKIYTVGIGDKKEIDFDLLHSIAEKTGGIFFHAKTSGELGNIFEEINKLEKHNIETIEFVRFNNVGYKFASIGIYFLLIGLISNILFFKRLS